MHLQLKKVVLWPRKGGIAPRIVSFETGTVNVISGLSKTGKSAIIPIIDYCLGSERCAIPVQTIRNACSWFGVVFDSAQGELLLARREPGSQKATGDMFVLQGPSVEIPSQAPQANNNVTTIKGMLDELAGLTQLEFDVEGTGVGFKGRPSFRDMTAFIFQPQNIVANPNVLFYKADTSEHREKLRTIFPYVLGAVTTEVLALEHERQRLRLVFARKERELQTMRQLSLNWLAEIRAKASRAYELGLLPQRPQESASVPELLEQLRLAAAPVGTLAGREPDLNAGALGAAAEELVALQREESSASARLSHLKQRYGDMARFLEAATEYRGSLAIRRDRLQISDWIGGLFEASHECPLCGTHDVPVTGEVAALQLALRHVEDQEGDVAQLPASFDREYQRVRQEIDLETERLNAVRLRRRLIQATSEEARSRQYQLSEAARFAGGLEEALARYDQLTADGELASEVGALRERVGEIEARLRAINPAAATERTLQRFSLLVGRILPRLDAERKDDPVHLVIGDLTLKVTGGDREDFLWEIGSGANWLSYHIATSVALHQLLRSLPQNHVPTFVVYDQPSQVYFPRLQMGDTRGEATSSTAQPRLRDEDVRAVRLVFHVLADAVRESKGEWQALVLDHAGPDVWGDIPGVHLVEDWHEGGKLVPDEWIA